MTTSEQQCYYAPVTAYLQADVFFILKFARMRLLQEPSDQSQETNLTLERHRTRTAFVCLFFFLFFAVRVVFKNAVTKRGLVSELFAPSRGLAKPISSFSEFS